jgi:hypothetical protein
MQAVQRAVTSTPLARQYELLLDGRGRKVGKPIPWGAFDREKYPPAALALACDAQTKLALGEYGAVDLFSHIASALALNGAPFDIIANATRVPTDEIRHADYAVRMASLIAGKDVRLPVNRTGLEKRWREPVDQERLDYLMLEVAAVSETLACALLSACLERARDACLHALFSSVLSDEVHHARIGWYYLSWRSPQWTRAERQRVADRAGELLVNVEPRFWRGRDAPRSASKAARALGVLESKGQRQAVRSVMENEIVPALDSFGLGASHAWRVRRRGR